MGDINLQTIVNKLNQIGTSELKSKFDQIGIKDGKVDVNELKKAINAGAVDIDQLKTLVNKVDIKEIKSKDFIKELEFNKVIDVMNKEVTSLKNDLIKGLKDLKLDSDKSNIDTKHTAIKNFIMDFIENNVERINKINGSNLTEENMIKLFLDKAVEFHEEINKFINNKEQVDPVKIADVIKDKILGNGC